MRVGQNLQKMGWGGGRGNAQRFISQCIEYLENGYETKLLKRYQLNNFWSLTLYLHNGHIFAEP